MVRLFYVVKNLPFHYDVLKLLSIGRGAFASKLLKGFIKVREVIKTTLKTDFSDL